MHARPVHTGVTMSSRCLTRYVKRNGLGPHRTDAHWEEYKLGIAQVCESAACHTHGEMIRADTTSCILGWYGHIGAKAVAVRFETEYRPDLAAEDDGVVIMHSEFETVPLTRLLEISQ